MLQLLARKLFGTVNERLLRSFQPLIDQVNGYQPSFRQLSDAGIAEYCSQLKQRFSSGESLDALLPEMYALVRESSHRTLGLCHYDEQILGGIILHKGMITEMRTGEGKTLAATLAVSLNALPGKGVHVVTVNDYLAARDAEWMSPIYRMLGLRVGVILHKLSDEERRAAYECDITYATNNELGFDYLRDNMRYEPGQMVHRRFHYAIVDEVDSILIDEARTPLVISGPSDDNTALYSKVNPLIGALTAEDYEKDEKSRSVSFTDRGNEHMETLLKNAGLIEADSSLYDIENMTLVHHATQALRAHRAFQRDVDYLVRDNQVMIIDEFTGRVMEGRRYGEGLHQAIEAKEQVPIQNENQTLASITYQNYFRLYPKLAGMTGTAMTEAAEFKDIYNLDVVDVPTHHPIARQDDDDRIYRSTAEKSEAILSLIKERYAVNQPILVGTVSIEKSEQLSAVLTKHHIAHQVLNAKHHEKEASIIAQAGRPGRVTIATNMAGRGTDIQLGGNATLLAEERCANEPDKAQHTRIHATTAEEVARDKAIALEAGGLLVIGTERHESRRIDNQLRGRSGRQGDPGRSIFFLSLEDDLMRIFGSDRLGPMLQKLGLKEGEPITHPWISRSLEKAQQKVEARNYDMRKTLLKFDDVMNDQRKIIYEQRRDIMLAPSIRDTISDMRHAVIEDYIDDHMPPHSLPDHWDIEALEKHFYRIFSIHMPLDQWSQEEDPRAYILSQATASTEAQYQTKIESYGEDLMARTEKYFLLLSLDQLWKEHLHTLDHLRQGINLRAYGQKDPLNEYKREAFLLFETMLQKVRELVIGRLHHSEVRLTTEDEMEALRERSNPFAHQYDGDAETAALPKVGRNDPCPCGSGRKFKHCHGLL